MPSLRKPGGGIDVVRFKETTFVAADSDGVLILRMDGADAATSFPDDSLTTPHTVTPVGDAQVDRGIADPYGRTDAGVLLLDGTGDGLSVPSDADFNLGAGEWTVKMWVRFNDATPPQTLIASGGPGSANYPGWKLVLVSGSLQWEYGTGGAATVTMTRTWTPSTDTWYHVAITRDSSNDIRMFIDGTQIGAVLNDATNYSLNSGCQVGYHLAGAEYTNGWIDDVVVKNNTADYTTNFTAPTAPMTPEYNFTFSVANGGYEILHVDTSSAAGTVNLPAASTFGSRELILVRHGSNTLNVNADGAETLNDQASPQTIGRDGSEWSVRHDPTDATNLYIARRANP